MTCHVSTDADHTFETRPVFICSDRSLTRCGYLSEGVLGASRPIAQIILALKWIGATVA
ncbi:MAG: hypothetical protein KME27_24610 [Lyngbya sp. HA4199-MV5]|nr:hypothetical protein [Lyngbya sp. HA4199-MV5]